MPNTMRWRYGDTNPVMFAVDAATVVEIGDLLWHDTDDVKPASQQADQGTATLNQQAFQDKFAGVAMQASRSGDTQPLRVATTGVFEFDCAASPFEVGALVGPTENAAGTALLNQSVVGVGAAGQAIGRCVRRASPTTTRVMVDIVGVVTRGGPQVPA